MAAIEGYVDVYEASDGGTGDPVQTFWQFFVGGQAVGTRNHRLAETMRIALETNSVVMVTYDPQNGSAISQVRIAFKYVCESRRIEVCDREPPEQSIVICETRRVAICSDAERPVSRTRKKASRA
jgi:hypothetical protein